MARNGQGQGDLQIQTQTQTLTPQQMLLVRLTEMPLNDLRERIDKELEDNPWLQAERPADDCADGHDGMGEATGQGGASDEAEAQTSPAAPDTDDYDDYDDGIPRDPNRGREEVRRRELADTEESFYDHLERQLGEYSLSERELEVARYLIGSIDSDGLLRTPLSQIADELDIYQNIQVSEQELEHLLTAVIQQMEPAGVGGRNLRECLTLQARRNYSGAARDQMLRLFQRHWDDFTHLRWTRIRQALRLDELELERLQQRVRHLNPRPGGSIGGYRSDNHPITPDFLVEINENNDIHVILNESDLPWLSVSPDAELRLSVPAVSKAEREAMHYLRTQVGNAQMFINAIRQRRESMTKTMEAITKLQGPFFLEGDETLLKPMKLEDVARLTGLDISTVSRVSNSKFVQTAFGVYPLRWFFTSAAKLNGGDVTVRKILSALKEIVDGEDRRRPLSDERLVELLREQGYDVARRTVAKYRTQLGIPDSRMRKR